MNNGNAENEINKNKFCIDQILCMDNSQLESMIFKLDKGQLKKGKSSSLYVQLKFKFYK
jgi:hypothetical protein